jgi:4a-hydroxytetrahydrobiopterin dehydratase
MAVSELARKKCEPCTAETPKLEGKKLEEMTRKLGGDWKIRNGRELEKEYKFKDFMGALAFTNRVAAVAEQEGHHPEIALGWGHVKLTIWTHIINGLSEADFVLAAKADSVL